MTKQEIIAELNAVKQDIISNQSYLRYMLSGDGEVYRGIQQNFPPGRSFLTTTTSLDRLIEAVARLP